MYIVLYCIVLYCIVLYCIALHCIALHCIALHCIALHCIALHCIALHCIALLFIVLYYIALHCITLYYNILYCRIILYCIVASSLQQGLTSLGRRPSDLEKPSLGVGKIHSCSIALHCAHAVYFRNIIRQILFVFNILQKWFIVFYLVQCLYLHELHCIALHNITLHYITSFQMKKKLSQRFKNCYFMIIPITFLMLRLTNCLSARYQFILQFEQKRELHILIFRVFTYS